MAGKEEVMEALRKVMDPHIGVNIVDMGFILGVKVDGKRAFIKMTLTTPHCPMGRILLKQAKEAVEGLGVKADVEMVFDPPWTPEMMSDAARKALGWGDGS